MEPSANTGNALKVYHNTQMAWICPCGTSNDDSRLVCRKCRYVPQAPPSTQYPSPPVQQPYPYPPQQWNSPPVIIYQQPPPPPSLGAQIGSIDPMHAAKLSFGASAGIGAGWGFGRMIGAFLGCLGIIVAIVVVLFVIGVVARMSTP
jgi:hypothetical protein